jgi:hypothetical protein
MALFLVFAVAVLLDEDILAGDGSRSVNHRGTQLVYAWAALAIVARMLPMALLDLLDERPAVCLDADGGVIRSYVRRRRFRWEDVVAVHGGRRSFKIRLARGRPIRFAGDVEGHDLLAVYALARSLWAAVAHS